MDGLRKIVKILIPAPIFRLIEPWGHWGEAILANVRYGFPARRLKIIGVTGTDGKTTTSTFIYNMFNSAGRRTGLITTVSIDTGKGPKPNPTRLTAVQSKDFFKSLKQAADNGVEWMVVETTSHALAQRRYYGAGYTLAVFTNLTHEHLDYHGTFERYRQAKLRLFQITAAGSGLRTGIVNAEDPSAKFFAQAVPKVITYGTNTGDLRAYDIQKLPTGSLVTAACGGKSLKFRVNLPGSFNVMNALAAAGVGLAAGLSRDQIERGIEATAAVEGRMNAIVAGQDFNLLIDYAHTPESFAKILSEVSEVTSGRLIVVFGSAGRRDAAKRPLQGEQAAKWGDLVYITEEDDRDEDGLRIMEEIAEGAKVAGKKVGKNLFLIHDRTEAINAAISEAKKGDSVLLLGKGHEKSILHGGAKLPWDEAGVARTALEKKIKA